jgi:TatD DNase family protein
MPHLIDSHCHLDGGDFDHDRHEVLARARAAGVSPFIVVGTGRTIDEIARACALASAEPDVYATVGLHPHDAKVGDEAFFARLEELACSPRVVAVGETGLDFHYDHSPRDLQDRAFRRQVAMARSLDKPIVCHVRNAHPEALALLRQEGAPHTRVVIHCFTGTPDDAAAYVADGYYLSFSGIVTFPGKSADPIRKAVKMVPPDRILVETDAPFLAPVPMRGRRNEPAWVVHTTEVVARHAGLPFEELCARTVANASAVFGLTAPTPTGIESRFHARSTGS